MLGDISYDIATLQSEGKKVFTFTFTIGRTLHQYRRGHRRFLSRSSLNFFQVFTTVKFNLCLITAMIIRHSQICNYLLLARVSTGILALPSVAMITIAVN